LVPDVDFKAQVHEEKIDERIENRLTSLNSLRTQHAPVTNAFRVFNETSGEIYPVTRFNNNTVFFSTSNPPRIFDQTAERATFASKLNENLILDEELTNSGSVRVFKFQLLNNNLITITDDTIGASFSTSVQFSRTDIFQTELYYDGQVLDVDTNIDRLTVGQYQVDYRNGIVYVGVIAEQDQDLGTINYKSNVISMRHTGYLEFNIF